MASLRMFHGIALLTAYVLATGCSEIAVAQQSSTQRSSTNQNFEGRISGRVVDARTGSALSRCIVQAVETRRGLLSPKTLTGEDGRFSLDGLPAAKYRLSASRHGYLTQAYEEHDNFSTAIVVGPGLVSENLTFLLTPGAILSGTVTDEAGEPVRQAQVTLYRDQDADGLRSTEMQQATMSDDRGSYELSGLRPGAYFLSVSARPWYAVHSQQMRPAGFEADAAPEDAALDVAYPTTFYPDVTDAEAATPIPVKGGERLQADFTLHPERAMHLRIPMSEAEMRKGIAVSISQSVFGMEEQLPLVMRSDGSGAMIVDGVLPGHYDVSVTNGGVTSHLSSEIREGTTDLSGAELQEEVAVTGTVVLGEGKLPRNSGIVLLSGHRRGFFAAIDEAGKFAVSVPPGSYQVVGQVNQHYIRDVSSSGADLVGRMLKVKAGASPKLQIRLDSSYGQIDGTVLHDGRPASAAMVLLVPEHPGENHVLFRRDQSDSDGTFTLAGILPGRYRLVAIERGWELEYANPRVLAPFLRYSKTIEVRGSDHLQASVELQSR